MAGARHDEGLANAASLHILLIMGRYLLPALQHFANAKTPAISGCYIRLLDVAMNFWLLLRHYPAAVHDLLKLEEVKHCYDECIGGISRGAPLVSAPDSDAALKAGAPGTLADAGVRAG
jgi:hypothetical protein